MVRILAGLLCLLIVTSVSAQETRNLAVTDGSTVEIDGTSNKTDWTVAASDFDGSFRIEDGEIVAAVFTVQASSIKSDRGVIMNRLITGALKTSEHAEIVYTLEEVLSSEQVEGGKKLTTRGSLLLAGVTQEVEMDVTVSETEGGLRFSGQTEISMPYYKIKPPTAMFGALHTGKDVTVRYEVVAVDELVDEVGGGR